jgi:hypothetical protein
MNGTLEYSWNWGQPIFRAMAPRLTMGDNNWEKFQAPVGEVGLLQKLLSNGR